MMRLHWKPLAVYVLILVPGLLAFMLWTEGWLRDYSLGVIEEQLKSQVQGLAAWVDVDDPKIDARIDQVGEGRANRITLMDRLGKVVADSALSGAVLAGLDNHLNRPEVQQSLRNHFGTSIRYSTSLDQELLYVAMQLPNGEGFIRVALPLDNIERRRSELRGMVAGLALLLAALGAGLVFWISRGSKRSIAALEEVARDLSRGNLSAPIPVSSREELAGTAGSLREIAVQLQRSSEELEAERGYLDAVLSSLNEGILVSGADGQIRYANPALMQILGLSQDPVGRLPLEIVRQPQVQEAVQRVLTQGDRVCEELALGERTLEVRVSAIRPETGKGAVVAIFHDISELRRLERVRRDFVANVSHELRTPLTSIRGYCETLQEASEGLTPQQQSFLGKIAANAAQLAEIVQALLDLSRIEQGKLRPRRERISVKDLGEELDKAYLERAREKKLEWTLDFDGVTTFSASRTLLLRALHNLVDNAFEHTDRGRIAISLRRDGSVVRFEVADTGVGIPEAEQARVFERFYRASGSRRPGRGSGVGLSIVKHIVALHGGKIWLESRWGRGTRVFFTLPQTLGKAGEELDL